MKKSRKVWAIIGAVVVLVVAVDSGWIAAVSRGSTAQAAAKTPAEATADCGVANTSVQPTGWPQPGAPFQTCEQYSATELLITLVNPKAGASYDYAADGNGGWVIPGDQVVVPDGYCYRIESVAVHISTSTATTKRNEKIALRDRNDPDPPGTGNRGIAMGPGINGVGASTYLDVQYAPNGQPGVMVSTASNVGGWVPDLCIQSRLTIGLDVRGEQAGDQLSEWKAIVEWQQTV